MKPKLIDKKLETPVEHENQSLTSFDSCAEFTTYQTDSLILHSIRFMENKSSVTPASLLSLLYSLPPSRHNAANGRQE